MRQVYGMKVIRITLGGLSSCTGGKSIAKFKDNLRKICKYGRGWSMTKTIKEANPKLR